ncbi:MAG: hypothetical protein IVW57_10910 [Ktedonobacterales bacterium]|nr:hypothetical protein [Ktedonobacterales bacterium]
MVEEELWSEAERPIPWGLIVPLAGALTAGALGLALWRTRERTARKAERQAALKATKLAWRLGTRRTKRLARQAKHSAAEQLQDVVKAAASGPRTRLRWFRWGTRVGRGLTVPKLLASQGRASVGLQLARARAGVREQLLRMRAGAADRAANDVTLQEAPVQEVPVVVTPARTWAFWRTTPGASVLDMRQIPS